MTQSTLDRITLRATLDDLFSGEEEATILDGFQSSDLVFVRFYYVDPITGIKRPDQYHLAHINAEGVMISACGIQITRQSSKLPDFASKREPKGLQDKVCQMCSSRSPEFSKKFYGGKKLVFVKSKTKPITVSHDSDEEAYRTVVTSVYSPSNFSGEVPF